MMEYISHLQIQKQMLDWIDDDMDVDIAGRKMKVDLNLEGPCGTDDKYESLMEEKRIALDSFKKDFKKQYEACDRAISRDITAVEREFRD